MIILIIYSRICLVGIFLRNKHKNIVLTRRTPGSTDKYVPNIRTLVKVDIGTDMSIHEINSDIDKRPQTVVTLAHGLILTESRKS